jgi:glycosyltransferase involved in cell wall biosynthesis
LGRVLIVTQEFFPSASVGARRPGKFCKYLPCFGWRARVLTTTEEYYGNVDHSLDAEMMARADIIRVPMRPLPRPVQAPLDWGRRLFLRLRGRGWVAGGHRGAAATASSFWWVPKVCPDPGAPWVSNAFQAGRRAVRDCQAIYSTYPSGSAHHVALKLARETGLPWIADFRDPWSFGTIVAGMPAWKRRINLRIERATVHRSRFVVSTTEAITKRFRRTYPETDPAKFVTIRNGYDPEDFPSQAELQGVTPRDGVFRAAYFGTLYRGREPDGLFQAIRQLLDSGAITADRFRLDLYGPPPPIVSQAAARFGLEKVIHGAGFVGYHEALRLMCTCSLLVLIGSAQTDDLCVATKLYEYLYARRPILALVPHGPIEQFVGELGAGRAVPGDDVEGIAYHLTEWYEAFQAGRLGPQNVEIPPDYNRKCQAERLAELLSAAVGGIGGRASG